MERELEAPTSSKSSSLIMWIFFTLSVSMGTLFHQFGTTPFDETLNLDANHYSLLLMATLLLTFYLAMASLLISFAMGTTRPLDATYARWIHHSGKATLALSVLPEAYTAFANSTLFSPQTVSWASKLGLILLAVTVAYKSINVVPVSWFQQYRKVGLFTLCVAVAGTYAESEEFMTASSIPYNSVMYQAYCIYRFGLVPCSFVLGVLLLILGIAVPDSSAPGQFVSVTCKEVFAKLTLSVGLVTLLAGAFLASVNLSTIDPAVLGGGSGAGGGDGVAMVMEVGAI